jgi:hypothetical protein
MSGLRGIESINSRSRQVCSKPHSYALALCRHMLQTSDRPRCSRKRHTSDTRDPCLGCCQSLVAGSVSSYAAPFTHGNLGFCSSPGSCDMDVECELECDLVYTTLVSNSHHS